MAERHSILDIDLGATRADALETERRSVIVTNLVFAALGVLLPVLELILLVTGIDPFEVLPILGQPDAAPASRRCRLPTPRPPSSGSPPRRPAAHRPHCDAKRARLLVAQGHRVEPPAQQHKRHQPDQHRRRQAIEVGAIECGEAVEQKRSIEAGGPAGKTRLTCAGSGIARPPLSRVCGSAACATAATRKTKAAAASLTCRPSRRMP